MLDTLTNAVRMDWGSYYLPAMYGPLFLYSCVLRYLMHEKVELPKPMRGWFLFAIFLMSSQMIMFIFSISGLANLRK